MLRAMLEHQPLLFEDAESVTRRPALNVVHASAASVAAFDVGYFAGFASMRALTYSTSVPMIAGLLAEHRFEDFECVFGHGGILSREAEEILAFQYAVREQLGACLLARPATDAERDAAVRQRVASDEVRFFVVKDAIAHAKIYLLSGPGKRRVMVGSANLSERAFSGRQAETLVVFDDDDVAWRHYLRQYEAVRDTATCRLPLPREPLPKEQVRVEETPALVEAEAHPEGATLFVPAQTAAEEACSVPAVTARIETIKPVLRRGLAGLRPGRDGRLRIAPKVVKEIVRIAPFPRCRSRAAHVSFPRRRSVHSLRPGTLLGGERRRGARRRGRLAGVLRQLRKRLRGRRAAPAARLLHVHVLVLLRAADVRSAQLGAARRRLQFRPAAVRRALRLKQLRQDQPCGSADGVDVLAPAHRRFAGFHPRQTARPATDVQALPGGVRRHHPRPLQPLRGRDHQGRNHPLSRVPVLRALHERGRPQLQAGRSSSAA